MGILVHSSEESVSIDNANPHRPGVFKVDESSMGTGAAFVRVLGGVVNPYSSLYKPARHFGLMAGD